MPTRIQRRRTKGYRTPPNTRYVGRGTPYGNPYKVGDPGVPDAATAVEKYRQHLRDNADLVARIRAELAGCDHSCFCAEASPCHADITLHVAAGGQP